MSNNSRTANSIKNIITGFLGQVIQTVLSFVSRTIFIKYLATEYLGINGLFTNILSILSLAELGIGSAIIYALYKPLADNDEKEISALMNFYAKAYKTIGFVVIIMGLSILPFIKIMIKDISNVQDNIYVIFSFYLFNTAITYFFSYKNSIIVADQKNYITSIISYGISFSQTILQIIVLVLTRNFLLYLLVQSISLLLYNVIISRKADKMYPYIKNNNNVIVNGETKKSLVINIKSLMVVKISGVLVNNTDNMIITYFSGLSAVGLCSNYNMIIGIINSTLIQIFNGITASIGNVNAKESIERKEELFDIINFVNFWLFGFFSICIVLLLNDVITLWVGNEYVLPISISIVLAINFYMVGMQNAVWTYKNTMGLFRYGRYLLLLTAVINLILSMVLGKYIGLFGILISTTIARLFTNTWYDPYVVYQYGFNKNVKSYLIKYVKYLLIIIVALISTSYICSLINAPVVVYLILKLFVCIIVPNSMIILIFYNSKEFKYVKNIIVKILFKLNKIDGTKL